MEKIITDFLKQLEPLVGIVITVLIVAVIYLWRKITAKEAEIERLRIERNQTIEKKDEDLRRIAEAKDKDYKDLAKTVIEIHEKSIATAEKLANNVNVNTEATKRIEMLITNFNAVLTARRK